MAPCLEELNAHLATRSYLGNPSRETLEDYRLCKELSGTSIDQQKMPHLHRWYKHVSYLMAKYPVFDYLGGNVVQGQAPALGSKAALAAPAGAPVAAPALGSKAALPTPARAETKAGKQQKAAPAADPSPAPAAAAATPKPKAKAASTPAADAAEEPKPLGCLQVLPDSAHAASPQKTDPVFLTDTYLFELANCGLVDATVSPDAPKGAPEGHVKLQVILDRTVFHPQGGGQPADVGQLSAAGLQTLQVSFTSTRKDDGAILHDCVTAPAHAHAWGQAAKSGAIKVHCRVDEAVRRLNARVHSAGHLLDKAVQDCDWKWIPGKGYHFPDGPYVEYVLNEDSRKIDAKKPAEKDKFVKDLQAAIDRLVAAGGPVLTETKAGVRHVSMLDVDCPCGGTHVKDVAELLKVEVKKIQAKQGNMRVSYTVSPAA